MASKSSRVIGVFIDNRPAIETAASEFHTALHQVSRGHMRIDI
jgi:hypothetical protein